jgi:hypothetical protein
MNTKMSMRFAWIGDLLLRLASAGKLSNSCYVEKLSSILGEGIYHADFKGEQNSL